MRDTIEGPGSGASDTEPSDSLSASEDSRCRFLDILFLIASYEVDVLLEEAPEVSLSEFGDEREEAGFCWISCGIAADNESRALSTELAVEGSGWLKRYLSRLSYKKNIDRRRGGLGFGCTAENRMKWGEY